MEYKKDAKDEYIEALEEYIDVLKKSLKLEHEIKMKWCIKNTLENNFKQNKMENENGK